MLIPLQLLTMLLYLSSFLFCVVDATIVGDDFDIDVDVARGILARITCVHVGMLAKMRAAVCSSACMHAIVYLCSHQIQTTNTNRRWTMVLTG